MLATRSQGGPWGRHRTPEGATAAAYLPRAGGPPPRPGMSPSSDPASSSDSIAAGLWPLAPSCMAWSAPFGWRLPSAARGCGPGRVAPGPAGDWKSRLNCGRCGNSDLHSNDCQQSNILARGVAGADQSIHDQRPICYGSLARTAAGTETVVPVERSTALPVEQSTAQDFPSVL